MTLSFLVERVRHGSVLSTSEVKILVEEIERLTAKLEGCVQEVSRREEAAEIAREQDSDRAVRLRLAEEDVARLRPALEHEKQRREAKVAELERRVVELEGILKDIGYGLLYQPEHSREELAGVIDRAVGSHPKPL